MEAFILASVITLGIIVGAIFSDKIVVKEKEINTDMIDYLWHD